MLKLLTLALAIASSLVMATTKTYDQTQKLPGSGSISLDFSA